MDILVNCRSVINNCKRLLETDAHTNELLLFVISRLEFVERNLLRTNLPIPDVLKDEIITTVQNMLQELRSVQSQSLDAPERTAYRAPLLPNKAKRGHLSYDISKEQLQFLIDCNFNNTQVAEILGCSVSTVKRRLRLYTLQQNHFETLSDETLDRKVKDLVGENEKLGAEAVRARLLGSGFKVQRHRVRQSLVRINPEAAAQRAIAQSVTRRTYRVAGPNSLWHIDGNHKLIRWRIVIHGGIDGFSRMLTFLSASNNNRSETVLNVFIQAVVTYGLPSRVRVDNGGENNGLCELMEMVRGGGRGSAIRGRSTHNQRIERAWVDVWNGVSNLYYDLFSFLEEEQELDLQSEVHIWALHYIYLPRINRDLKLFCNQWNSHAIRTEHHRSPLQLFVSEMLALQNSGLTAVQEMFSNDMQTASIQMPADMNLENLIQVPETAQPISTQEMRDLSTRVNPLDETDVLGINSFKTTLEFLTSLRH